jgi:Zn-dependent M28 family amino/carboxypeptidase
LELTQEGVERLLTKIGQVKASNLEDAPAHPLGVEARIEIPIGPPLSAETVNVLGLLPGSDPALKREVIILGAHYDHVGDDPDALLCSAETPGASGHAPNTTCELVEGRRYAGANDDASGVGVLLEIARLWHEAGYQPRRSVLFAAWGAQEAGELGSRYYVENPVLPLEQTVAMLQLDAVGGGRGYYLEAQGGGEREGLLLFNLMVAEDWVDGRLALKDRWSRSDQVSFREAGIPTLLLTWREASEDNWPVEIADLVEPYRLGVTGRMVSLAVMALAR